ncbi:acyl-CoA dehydrogenase [Aestuariicella hydrocarbonica]|uniref:Acyl-CoA dehydrogenase n=1 Tax=Pseudomaricurvus hydrocarbonicus TaxID=1470433 RepID=A0A9E5MKP6_9GAMM|nr:acyl-CoA dehydrogenase family protein [Aestuariicella hydrocarbonica]NHO66849.1 acyl-CoA dehydrogenase [Aestuariicella hydrocarbonica]
MSDIEFREEVRAFIREALTTDIQRAGELMTSVFANFDATMTWHRRLNEKGWVAPDWPEEYGGTGWSLNQRYIFQEECKLANAPSLLAMGIQMLGPMLIHYGTEEQKAYYLPRILSGEDVWCQGYSEPGAGSDLASLKTSAVRDGDDYLINGSKIWTSYAQFANKIFCLVRTSKEGKPQAGISFILVDMDAEGIQVDPIVGLDGVIEQCQVFFDNVRVSVSQLVGKENEGWEVAKYLLEFERGGHNFTIDHKKQMAKICKQAVSEYDSEGRLWAQNPVFNNRFADVAVDALALEYTELRIKGALNAGGNPGALSSLCKVMGTEIGQRFNELSMDILGVQALPKQLEALEPDFQGEIVGPDYALTTMPEYINNRASTIYGGSAEIQRDIIAKRVLGL